jgi:hypothetical protein
MYTWRFMTAPFDILPLTSEPQKACQLVVEDPLENICCLKNAFASGEPSSGSRTKCKVS